MDLPSLKLPMGGRVHSKHPTMVCVQQKCFEFVLITFFYFKKYIKIDMLTFDRFQTSNVTVTNHHNNKQKF